MKKVILIIVAAAIVLNAEVSLEEISKIRKEAYQTVFPAYSKAKDCWRKKLIHDRITEEEYNSEVQSYVDWNYGLYSTTSIERSVNRKEFYEAMAFTPTYLQDGKRYFCVYTIWNRIKKRIFFERG